MDSIGIPSSVISIGNKAFDGCDKLTSIVIPDSVTSIGKGAFCGCVKLDDVSQNDIILRFGDEVFEPCPIELLINWAECDLDQTSEDLELDDTMEL